MQRVAKKDGSELMGYLVSNGNSEIVMRDAAGKRITIPKSQITALEKIPGSLMPAGLTAGLEKEEFVNLIGFLSRLGEPGDYRVPNTRFVRRWTTVAASKELAKKINDEGVAYVVKQAASILSIPAYSNVAGNLPIEELPVLEASTNKKYSVVSFEIEVLNKGQVHLLINSIAGITAWVGQQPLTLTDQGLRTELPQGIHQITLVLDRNILPKGPLGIQLQEAAGSGAQTRLVMGQ